VLSILLIFYAIYLNVQLSDANKRIKQLVLEAQNTEARVDSVEEKIFDTENKLEKQIKLTDEKFARLHEKQMNEVENIKRTVAKKADRGEVATVSIRKPNERNYDFSFNSNTNNYNNSFELMVKSLQEGLPSVALNEKKGSKVLLLFDSTSCQRAVMN